MRRIDVSKMRKLSRVRSAVLWVVCVGAAWAGTSSALPAQTEPPQTPVTTPHFLHQHSRSPQFENAPRLPSIEGCYTLTKEKTWAKEECLSDEYVRANLPRAAMLAGGRPGPPSGPPSIDQLGIQFGYISNQQTGYPMPITGGAVDIGFTSLGTVTDSVFGAGYFSIQLNTNIFSLANGDQAAVQFMDFHQPSTAVQKGDSVCISSVDATAQAYHSTCHATIVGRAPQSGDFAAIQAYQDFQQPGYLKMVFQLTWDSANTTYGLVAPDVYGLTHAWNTTGGANPAENYNGNWNQLSGSILGFGNGSVANFSASQLWVGIDAWNCEYDASNACIGYAPGLWTWSATKRSLAFSNLTQEQNNLSPANTWYPGMPTGQLPTLQCPGWNGCNVEYSVSAP